MNTSDPPVRVVLYARISEDVSGDGMKVTDQLERCRQFAAERGWTVIDEITDNDISALKGNYRPGYAEVLRLVRIKAIDQVVVWQSSRLLRNRRERAEAIELFGRQRVGIIAVKGISFDLSTAYGRGQAGLMGEFDTMESEVKAERVLAAASERAQKGRPSGSLGYGWTKIGVGRDAVYREEPHEAGVVREIVDRLLKGESLLGITRDLNERGEPPPGAAAWAALNDDERQRRIAVGRKAPRATWGKTSVKKLALRESNIAVRVHHRGREDEARYEGAWPALVDESKHQRVAALLNRPARRTNGGVVGVPGGVARPGARRHLLTWGVAVCGECGGRLRVAMKGNAKWGRAKPLYYCAERGCVGRSQEYVDALVRDVVIERLGRPDAINWLLGDDTEARRHADRVDDLRQRLNGAAEDYADGVIDREQLRRINARLKPEMEAAEAQRQRAAATLDLEALRPLSGPMASMRWDGMPVASQRAVIESIGLKVTILKVTRRGPGFDQNSVKIEWVRHGR